MGVKSARSVRSQYVVVSRVLSCIAAVLFLFLSPAGVAELQATPFYTLASANACDTCHVEPIGWKNPDRVADRRCSLDCQGCHISPTGGGGRKPMGRYYARESLSVWGDRPSNYSDMKRFLKKGAPSEGRFRLLDGFSGWWPGEVNHRKLKDWLGDIDPDPTFSYGGDIRVMSVVPFDDTGREFAAFPMQAQGYFAYHYDGRFTTYVDFGWQGSQAGLGKASEDQSTGDFLQARLWLREIFEMLHDGPYGSYVRVGRFTLPYGWRLPDHTTFTRKGLFDQFRQGYGLEVGFAPNEYWGNLMLHREGIEGWPGEPTTTRGGWGATAQGGLRYLGYTLGMSLHGKRTDDDNGELMAGPLWGVNFYPLTYLGELDFRRFVREGDAPATNSMYMLNEVRFVAVRGFTPSLRHEWKDDNLVVRDDHQHRISLGIDFNPLPYIQLLARVRANILFNDQPNPYDALVQVHAYY